MAIYFRQKTVVLILSQRVKKGWSQNINSLNLITFIIPYKAISITIQGNSRITHELLKFTNSNFMSVQTISRKLEFNK